MRHLVVIGTKAQLIKMAPIMQEMERRGIDFLQIWTGQHHDKMRSLAQEFSLPPPDRVLGSGQDITGVFKALQWVTGLALASRSHILGHEAAPDGVCLTHGDTLSTYLGYRFGRRLGIPIGHVEAGLRSKKMLDPFPEELIRRFVDRRSDLLFAPWEDAVTNLRNEGLRGQIIHLEENTTLDTVRFVLTQPAPSPPLDRFALVTIHRFENIFNAKRLRIIIDQIRDLTKVIPVLFILHLPTRKQLLKAGLLGALQRTPDLMILGRRSYFEFIHLMARCEFLITDGGGPQEEARYLGVPCFLMRHTTERWLGQDVGFVLGGLDAAKLTDFAADPGRFRQLPIVDSDLSPTSTIVDTLSTGGEDG